MKINEKIVAVIQCTSSDFYESLDENDYCISKLKESNLFNSIILVMPNLEESYQYSRHADLWGVNIYFGDIWDVSIRIFEGVQYLNPDIIVRVLLKRFYLDIELIKKQIEFIKNGADIALLSRDVNYEISADVFSYKALVKVIEEVNTISDNYLRNAYKFAPWTMMDEISDFKSPTINYKELWDKNIVLDVKKKLEGLIGKEENKNHVSISNPSSRYSNLLKYIDKNDTLLDIACGQGIGVYMLSKNVKKAYGIDYNKIYIDNAKKKFIERNLHYYYGTDNNIKDLGIKFSVVTSLHTMEHVSDDIDFLRKIYNSLIEGGKLLLEVPRLMKYPLGEPLYYFHLREYEQEDLEKKILSVGFHISAKYGCNRHSYTHIDLAREGFFYICVKNNSKNE